LEAAYAVQDALIALQGGRRVGYKIGATSKRAQSYLGLEGPLSGQVLSGTIFRSPANIPADGLVFALAEPEFAFRIREDLPARERPFDRERVEAALGALMPAMEIVTSVWESWAEQGAFALIADNGAHGCLVLGEDVEDWRSSGLPEHRVRIEINGAPRGEGTGANCLGHPLNALTWLANETAGRGEGLRAGEVVTTGVVTPFHYLEFGDEVVADFGRLGRVSLRYDPPAES
jgi:2-keto-4-pentenoate hydratase